MISYDSYKNRILKLAAVKNFIVRFRVLILSVLAVIIALVAAFLGTKGVITRELVLPERIIYGDNYTVENASALFSKTGIEFSDENGVEWGTVKPLRAGKYYARTTTDKAFKKGYGKPIPFEIERKTAEFIIKDTAVVYGQVPGSYTFELVNGDTLYAEGLSYSFDSFEMSVTNVCANASSVIILSPLGEDVTDCYDIVTPKQEVRFVEKIMTVTPIAFEETYNGKAIHYESVVNAATTTALAGDRAVIVTQIKDGAGNVVEGMPVNAGRYTVEIVSAEIYRGEELVTERYSLTFAPASLVINRRPITVKTASAERVYNAASLFDREFTFEGEVEGHTLRSDDETVSILNVGETQNKYLYRVYDGEEDCTENYAFTYEYGTLKILPRPVTVTTITNQKVYDGTPLDGSAETETIKPVFEGIVEGETYLAQAGAITAVTQVYYEDGEVKGVANLTKYDFFNAAGEEDNGNYAVEYVPGVLTVTRRTVTVITDSAKKEYDGTPLFNEAGTVVTNTAEGERYAAVEIAERTDAGESENVITYAFFNAEGEDVTASYDIQYTYKTLTVTKRLLNAYTQSATFIYNGGKHSNPAVKAVHVGAEEAEDSEFTLVDGHAFSYADVTEVEDVLRDGEGHITGATNTFTLTVKNGEEDKTENYDIKLITSGVLTVTEREITVYSENGSYEYDGAHHTHEYAHASYTGEVVNGEIFALVEGHGFRYVAGSTGISTLTDVSSTENHFEVEIFAGDAEKTGNYKIAYDYEGILSVYKRRILVKTNDFTHEYDGQEHKHESATSAHRLSTGAEDETEGAFGLVTGHEFVYHGAATITDVIRENGDPRGEVLTKDNTFTVTVKDGDRDVTANYDIPLSAYRYGALKITPKPLTITTLTNSKTYDGAALDGSVEEEGHKPVFDGKLTEETYAVDYSRQITNVFYREGEVSSVDNDTTYFIRKADGITESTHNYVITYVKGTLTINRREITLTTATYTKVYDGTPLLGHDADAASHGFAMTNVIDGEETRPDVIAEMRNVLRIEGFVSKNDNTTTYKIWKGLEDSTPNYLLPESAITYGTLEITPRTLRIDTDSITKEYDGETVYGQTVGATATNAAENQTAYPVTNPEITEVKWNGTEIDSISNNVEYKVRWSDGVTLPEGETEDVTDNYTFETHYGTLTITPRLIYVYSESGSYEYDGTAHTHEYANAKHRLADDSVDPNSEAVGLVTGHTFSYVAGATGISTLTDVKIESGAVVGVENHFEVEIREDGADKTKNYDIKYKYDGVLTVTKRLINLYSDSMEWEYDGIEHKHESGTPKHYKLVEGSRVEDEAFTLVSGHVFAYSNATTITNVKRAGNLATGAVEDVQNSFTVAVKAGERDVTDNYDIHYIYSGTLKVTPRLINAYTVDGEWTYDGNAHTKEEVRAVHYSVEGADKKEDDKAALVLTHVFAYANAAKVTVVGDTGTVNTFTLTVQMSSTDTTDVTGNYTLNRIDDGKLTINPRPVHITTITAEKNYDNNPLEGDEGTGSSDLSTLKVEGIAGNAESGLVSGESYIADSNNVTSIIDVLRKNGDPEGEVLSVDNETEYLFKNKDGVDVTDCYDITYTPGKLKIKPVALSITTSTITVTYTGTTVYGYNNPAAEDAANKNWVADGLVGSDAASPVQEGAASMIDVLWEGGVAGGVEDGKQNETKFTVASSRGDATGNYVITYTYGTLKLLARDMTITIVSPEKEYDGTPLKGNEGQTHSHFAGLVDADTFEPVLVTTLTEVLYDGSHQVTTKPNYTTYKFYGTGERAEVETTKNYRIAPYSVGTLKVTPRSILIESESESWTYDGTEHKHERATAYHLVSGVKDTAEGAFALVTGHHFVYSNAATITDVIREGSNVGSKQNRFIVRVEDGAGNDVTEYYTSNYEDGAFKFLDTDYGDAGTLTVNPKELTITTVTNEKVYDGTPLDGGVETETAKLTVVGLIKGEKPEVAVAKTVTDVTYEGTSVVSVPNDTTYSIVKADGTTDSTGNYNITYSKGTLLVKRRAINVTTASDNTHVYNGQPYKNGTFTHEGYDAGKERGLLTNLNHKIETVESTVPTVTDVYPLPKENNIFDVRIYVGDTYSEANDKTKNYLINYTHGTVAVQQCEVTVSLLPFNATNKLPYNGQDVAYPGYVAGNLNYTLVSGSFVTGEEFEAVVYFLDQDGNVCTPRNAGKYKAVLCPTYQGDDICSTLDVGYCMIHKGGVSNDASNYKVTCAEMEFEIEAKTLTVKTGTQDFEYDGDSHGYYEKSTVTVIGLATGHDYNVDLEKLESFGKITNVNESPVDNVVYIRVYDEDGVDVTSSYQFDDDTYEWGKLTVSPRKLLIITATDEHVYDGAPFYNYGATAYHVTGEPNPGEYTYDGEAGHGLIGGHELSYLTFTSETNVVEGKKNICTYKVIDGEKNDVSSNYTLVDGAAAENYAGTLTITKRPVTVTILGDQKTYDGTPLEKRDFTYEPFDAASNRGLVEDYTYTAADGTEQTVNHTIELDAAVTVSITNVSENKAENNVLAIIIKASGVDVTETNYDVSYVYGDLVINPAEVKLTLNAAYYDDLVYGDAFPNPVYPTGASNCTVSAGSFGLNETYEAVVFFLDEEAVGEPDPATGITPKNAGTYYVYLNLEAGKLYKNSVLIPRLTGSEPEGTVDYYANYEITQEACSFQIEKREITVTLVAPAGAPTLSDGSFGKIYDGASYSLGQSFTAPGMQYGETLTVVYDCKNGDGDTVEAPEDADVYVYDLLIDDCTVGEKAATDNYIITAGDPLAFTIKPKPIDVKVNSVTREYNGALFDYFDEEHVLVVTGFCDSDTTITTATIDTRNGGGESTNAKQYGIYQLVMVKDNLWKAVRTIYDNGEPTGEKDVTHNYELGTITNATLSITKRKIGVAIGSSDNKKIVTEYTANELDEANVMSYFTEHLNDSNVMDGMAGIVSGDERYVTVSYTYWQSGVKLTSLPVVRGSYDVRLTLSASEEDTDGYFARNYDVANIYYDTTGVLEISYRYVGILVDNIEDFTYANKKFDQSVLSYSDYHATEDGNIVDGADAGSGFCETINSSEFSVGYEIIDHTNDLNTVYDFNLVIHGGSYTANAVITVNGTLQNMNPPEGETLKITYGNYMITVCVGADFTVEKRSISVRPEDLKTVYGEEIPVGSLQFTDHEMSENEPEEPAAREGTENTGFFESDRDLATADTAVLEFALNGEEVEEPTLAGSYVLRIKEFDDVMLKRDYAINSEDAKLVIFRRIFVFKAGTETSPLATDEALALGPDNYVPFAIKITRGGVTYDNKLVYSDTMTVVGDQTFNLETDSKKYIKVGISSCSILDGEGNPAGDNYIAIYKMDGYTEYKNKEEEGVKIEDIINNFIETNRYKTSTFQGRLEYEFRKIVISQRLPDDFERNIPYDGSSYSIPFNGNGSELFRYVSDFSEACALSSSVTSSDSGVYGLLAGHHIEVYSTKVGNKPGTYSDWLKCKVYDDSTGVEIKNYYVYYDRQSAKTSITLVSIEITITVFWQGSATEIGKEVAPEYSAITAGDDLLEGHMYALKVLRSGTNDKIVSPSVFVPRYDANGDEMPDKRRDRSAYYKITILYELCVKTESKVETYDGNPHTFNELDEAGLGWLQTGLGHTMNVSGFTAYTNVMPAKVPNIATDYSVNDNGSGIYAPIVVDWGQVNIAPLELNITVNGDGEAEYSGSVYTGHTLSCSGFEALANAALKAGVQFSGTVIYRKNGVPATPLDAIDGLKATLDYNSWTITGDDKGNYTIGSVVEKDFKITPRKVTVSLRMPQNKTEKLYDGENLTYSNDELRYKIESGSFVEGETVVDGVYFTNSLGAQVTDFTNASTYVAHTRGFKVYRGTKDITDPTGIQNYEITVTGGTVRLSVLARTIMINLNTPISGSYQYNGKAVEYAPGSDLFTYAPSSQRFVDSDVINFVVGYSTRRGGDPTLKEAKNQGTYYVCVDWKQSTFVNSKGDSVINNYDLYVLNDGYVSFTIAKREINITLQNASAVYSGTDFNYLDAGYTIGVSGLLEGATFDGGAVRYSNNTAGIGEATPNFADTYYIFFDDSFWTVTQNGIDDSGNYVIGSAPYSTLVISHKQISVSLNPVSGEAFSGENYTPYGEPVIGNYDNYNEEGLTLGDEMKISVYYTAENNRNATRVTPRAVGTYYVWFDTAVITSAAGNDVSSNYNVTQMAGEVRSFRISERNIDASISSMTVSYSGVAFNYTAAGYTVTYTGTLPGVTFNYTVVARQNGEVVSAIAPGTYELTIADGWTVTGGNASDYVLGDVTVGTLTIQAITINVRMDSEFSLEDYAADTVLTEGTHYTVEGTPVLSDSVQVKVVGTLVEGETVKSLQAVVLRGGSSVTDGGYEVNIVS